MRAGLPAEHGTWAGMISLPLEVTGRSVRSIGIASSTSSTHLLETSAADIHATEPRKEHSPSMPANKLTVHMDPWTCECIPTSNFRGRIHRMIAGSQQTQKGDDSSSTHVGARTPSESESGYNSPVSQLGKCYVTHYGSGVRSGRPARHRRTVGSTFGFGGCTGSERPPPAVNVKAILSWVRTKTVAARSSQSMSSGGGNRFGSDGDGIEATQLLVPASE